MNWDDLRIFVAVARHNKLATAARSLRMDETTVSRRIRRLESQLGQTLFERLRRGHHLTPLGQRLLDKTEQMEVAARSITQSTDQSGPQLTGSLRISAAEGFGAKIIAPALAAFKREYPSINIDLVSGSGFLNLSRREADIAIGLSRSKSKRIHSTQFANYKLGLYASKQWVEINGTPATIDDIQNAPMIGYIDDLIYAQELRYLEEALPRSVATLRSSQSSRKSKWL
jgi:DNA-binding transcriptional LysR family regulator